MYLNSQIAQCPPSSTAPKAVPDASKDISTTEVSSWTGRPLDQLLLVSRSRTYKSVVALLFAWLLLSLLLLLLLLLVIMPEVEAESPFPPAVFVFEGIMNTTDGEELLLFVPLRELGVMVSR